MLQPHGPVVLYATVLASVGYTVYVSGDYAGWPMGDSLRSFNLVDSGRIVVDQGLR